jgi:hypothetical protein
MIMRKFYCICFVLFFCAVVHVNAQLQQVATVNANTVPVDKLSLGVGIGYDFGGLGGVNAIYYLQRSIGVFGGGGYTPAGIGYGGGVKLRVLTNKQATVVVPFAVAMYGYYAAIAPKGYSYYNRIYFGPIVGIGADYRPGNSKFGYITGTIFVAIRNMDPKNYIDYLTNFQGINVNHKLHALSASIGYKFILFH